MKRRTLRIAGAATASLALSSGIAVLLLPARPHPGDGIGPPGEARAPVGKISKSAPAPRPRSRAGSPALPAPSEDPVAAKRRESTFVRLRAHEFPVPISVEFLLRSAGLGPDERLGDEEEEAILALLEEYSHMSREFMTEESEVQDQIIKEKLARGEYYDEETFTPLYQHDAWFATPRCFAGPKLDGKYVYVVLFEEDVDPRLLELEERRAQAIEDILAQIHALIRKR